ncbi:MAG: DUF1385 domain-containing protein [Anaerolineae bacterium]|nr:DUF1385 domain-containing protein [Anaerolineae bacterium]
MPASKMPHYGGQALIEGVLMRGKHYLVASFRKPNGEIVTEEEKLTGIYQSGLAKLPFLRGLVILWDSLSLGMKYITISANYQAESEDEKIEGGSLAITMLISVGLAIGLFFVLPTFLAEFIARIMSASSFGANIVEGLMRLAILIGYIWVIGRTPDIARVFAYHGSEHKTINAFEDNAVLNVDTVMKYPLEHPRCGTAFLLTLVVLSVLVFSLLGPMTLWLKILSRVALVPLLAMLSYEVIRWMGDHLENPLVRLLVAPNLALQKLTTRQPDPKMVEVALTSFKQLLKLEENETGK